METLFVCFKKTGFLWITLFHNGSKTHMVKNTRNRFGKLRAKVEWLDSTLFRIHETIRRKQDDNIVLCDTLSHSDNVCIYEWGVLEHQTRTCSSSLILWFPISRLEHPLILSPKKYIYPNLPIHEDSPQEKHAPKRMHYQVITFSSGHNDPCSGSTNTN